MSIEQMRSMITQVYPGPIWSWRVKNMSDNQVIAVYHNFMAKGLFTGVSWDINDKKDTPPKEPKQLSIFDFIKED